MESVVEERKRSFNTRRISAIVLVFFEGPYNFPIQSDTILWRNSCGGHIPSLPCRRERVKELSELAGEFDLGKALGSRLMVPTTDVKSV